MAIPAQICLSRALLGGEQFSGELPPLTLPRLQEFDPGIFNIFIRLHRDHAGIGWLEGTLQGDLKLTCQRCDSRYDWVIDEKLKLAIAEDEEQELRLLNHCEPVLARDDGLNPREIVEDEVLLAMPMVPVCAECEARGVVRQEFGAVTETSEEPNPFAALRQNLGFDGADGAKRKK